MWCHKLPVTRRKKQKHPAVHVKNDLQNYLKPEHRQTDRQLCLFVLFACLFDPCGSSQVKALFVIDFHCFHWDPCQPQSPFKLPPPPPPQDAFNTFATFWVPAFFMKRWTSGAADPNHDRKGALSEITNATSSRRLLFHCLFHLRGSYPAAAADGPLHIWPRPINPPTPAGCRGLNHSFPLRQVFFLEGNPQKSSHVFHLPATRPEKVWEMMRGNYSAYKKMDGKQ